MTAPLLKNTENLPKTRRAAIGSEPVVLTDIYEEDVNIALWQRVHPEELFKAIDQLLQINPRFELSVNAQTSEIPKRLDKLLENLKSDIPMISLLVEDIVDIVSMFSCLFDLKNVGLRLTPLDRAMCPKFHVDRIPVRLITTYKGEGTEWLPHQCVHRDKLGAGSNGLADHESGLYLHNSEIQQLNTGDVALLKGEFWEGNEEAGLVHRSPAVKSGESRLLMTLDFVAS